MPATMIPIQSITLSASAASVTFSGIPQTYTDLVLRMSTRTANASIFTNLLLRFNGDANGNYGYTTLYGNGSGAASVRGASQVYSFGLYGNNSANSTANTFSNIETYIPNYTGSAYKQHSISSAVENNATEAYLAASADLWMNTAAITSIEITQSSGFIAGCTFHLYGIKKD